MYPQRQREKTEKILKDQWTEEERGAPTPAVNSAASTPRATTRRMTSATAATLLRLEKKDIVHTLLQKLDERKQNRQITSCTTEIETVEPLN